MNLPKSLESKAHQQQPRAHQLQLLILASLLECATPVILVTQTIWATASPKEHIIPHTIPKTPPQQIPTSEPPIV